jgi:hypothetical protein
MGLAPAQLCQGHYGITMVDVCVYEREVTRQDRKPEGWGRDVVPQ